MALLLFPALPVARTADIEPSKSLPPAPTTGFWPPAPDAPRVQFLTTISSVTDITGKPVPAGQDAVFPRPYGIRIANGCVYVCSAVSGQVLVLDLARKEVRQIAEATGLNFQKPIDIAVAADGVKYVADAGRNFVLAFDQNDKYVGRLGVKGMRPVALAVNAKQVFVADNAASMIRVFDRKTGEQVRTIDGPHTDPGRFGGPVGLAIDPRGATFVTDLTCQLQKFSADGTLDWVVGGPGDKRAVFTRPRHIACDPDGNLYVVDSALATVQLVDKDGNLIMHFGGQGQHPGSMDVPGGIALSDDPKDVALFGRFVHPAFDPKRLVIISNTLGDAKLNVYAFGQLKPGKTFADLKTLTPAP